MEKTWGKEGMQVSMKINIPDEKVEKVNPKDLETLLVDIPIVAAYIETVLKLYSESPDVSANCEAAFKKHLNRATTKISSICRKYEQARDHPKGKRLKKS
jgi:hypothetical protein